MRLLVYSLILMFSGKCLAAEHASSLMQEMVPYPLCKQAGDKLIAALPEDIKQRNVISPDVLAESLERVIPKRVENHTLIEDILFQSNPLESKQTALLLLLVAHNEALRAIRPLEKE